MSTDGPYEILDDRFRTGRCANGDNRLEVLYDGCRWAEGPLYLPAWRQLVWSDIPNDRILRWDEATGSVGVFRAPAGHSNGNTLDRQGRLVTCEQGNRRVTRTEPDGRVTVLAERFDGRRLNSRTTPSSAPTAPSGSPTRTSASPATTRVIAPSPRSARATCTGSTRCPGRCGSPPTVSTGPTA